MYYLLIFFSAVINVLNVKIYKKYCFYFLYKNICYTFAVFNKYSYNKTYIKMEELKAMVERINSLMDSIKIDNEKNINGNIAAGKRARKTSVELGKLLKFFRHVSVNANKK